MKRCELGVLDDGIVNKMEMFGDPKDVSSPIYHRKWSASVSNVDLLKSSSGAPFVDNPKEEELINEIEALELEILHLERYILLLYRIAFGRYLINPRRPSFCSDSTNKVSLKDVEQKNTREKPKFSKNLSTNDAFSAGRTNQSLTDEELVDKLQLNRNSSSHNRTSPSSNLLPRDNLTDAKMVSSQHRILADHLSASVRENISDTPCKLSEDIIKCISAVYCKLNHSSTTRKDLPYSPVDMSLSSSNSSSPPGQFDNWSEHSHAETTKSPSRCELVNGKNCSYSNMLQITRICVDGERFECASKLLANLRILVRRLESVNPTKMNNEEKLAFWINIRNAMVMHAIIANGLENDRIKITPSALKKSYNIGGMDINAHDIQTSILRCRSRHSEPSKGIFKFKTANSKHPYALACSEPLVHFALCSGTYSDPPVRVYTAKNLANQLHIAKEEFLRANIVMDKARRVVLPKTIELFMKDASINMSTLVDILCGCLPEKEREWLRQGAKDRPEKCVRWSLYESNFRYVLHKDLDSGRDTKRLVDDFSM